MITNAGSKVANDCTIDLLTKGDSAVKSHMRSANHKNNACLSMRSK